MFTKVFWLFTGFDYVMHKNIRRILKQAISIKFHPAVLDLDKN